MGEGGTDNESDRKSVWFGMPIWAWLGGGLVVVALVVVAVWDVSRTSSSSDNDESYVVEREVSWREAQKFCHIPPTAELLDRYYGQYSDGSGDNFHEQYFNLAGPDIRLGRHEDRPVRRRDDQHDRYPLLGRVTEPTSRVAPKGPATRVGSACERAHRLRLRSPGTVPFMAGSGDRYLSYDVHGSGIESLTEGLANLAMTPVRQRAAKEIVGELLTLNNAQRFVWYLPPATPEVCAYWDDAPTNLLWITNVGVHLKRGGPVTPLARPITYEKQDGDYIGWLLPGAEAGTGGGARPSEISTVLCPATSLRQPAGSVCPDCDIVHS